MASYPFVICEWPLNHEDIKAECSRYKCLITQSILIFVKYMDVIYVKYWKFGKHKSCRSISVALELHPLLEVYVRINSPSCRQFIDSLTLFWVLIFCCSLCLKWDFLLVPIVKLLLTLTLRCLSPCCICCLWCWPQWMRWRSNGIPLLLALIHMPPITFLNVFMLWFQIFYTLWGTVQEKKELAIILHSLRHTFLGEQDVISNSY